MEKAFLLDSKKYFSEKYSDGTPEVKGIILSTNRIKKLLKKI